MTRLRNISTGAVVSCSDETAARLGSEWSSVEVEPTTEVEPEKKPASKPRRSRTSTKSD